MRGDSVRDLYAKALALIGLAVLAGAGALMDYWPVQGSLPVVSFNNSLPSGPAALEARLALASRVVTPAPVARPRVTAPAVAAPLPVPTEILVVTVPADEPVAPPTAPAPAPTASPAAAVALPDPEPEPVQTTWVAIDAPIPAIESLAPPKVSLSHSEAEVAPPSANALQKAGGQVLNVGFALGTGVAKSFSAFGTAFSNIGKLFSLK